jgi:hypothetical protein
MGPSDAPAQSRDFADGPRICLDNDIETDPKNENLSRGPRSSVSRRPVCSRGGIDREARSIAGRIIQLGTANVTCSL